MPPHFFCPCQKKREWRPKEKRLLYGHADPSYRQRPTRLSHGPWKSYPTFGRGRLAALKYTALAVLGND